MVVHIPDVRLIAKTDTVALQDCADDGQTDAVASNRGINGDQEVCTRTHSHTQTASPALNLLDVDSTHMRISHFGEPPA